MKNRIKSIRSDQKVTQKEFANKLELSQNFIAQIEMGSKVPSDRTIKDICRIFNVNEEWLRSGSGEMYVPHTRNQQIFDFMNRVMDMPDEAFLKRLCAALSELNENELEALCKVAEKISKQD